MMQLKHSIGLRATERSNQKKKKKKELQKGDLRIGS